MNIIPVKVTSEEFENCVSPFVSKAKRGFVCMIPLYRVFNYILYCLHTGCQRYMIPVEKDNDGRPEISRQAVYYHFRKRCGDGSFKNVRDNSIDRIRDCLNLSEISFDGTQTAAKKDGESAAWQGRKKAETANILTVPDKNSNPAAAAGIIAGNHNDAYEPENSLRDIFRDMKKRNLPIT